MDWLRTDPDLKRSATTCWFPPAYSTSSGPRYHEDKSAETATTITALTRYARGFSEERHPTTIIRAIPSRLDIRKLG